MGKDCANDCWPSQTNTYYNGPWLAKPIWHALQLPELRGLPCIAPNPALNAQASSSTWHATPVPA